MAVCPAHQAQHQVRRQLECDPKEKAYFRLLDPAYEEVDVRGKSVLQLHPFTLSLLVVQLERLKDLSFAHPYLLFALVEEAPQGLVTMAG